MVYYITSPQISLLFVWNVSNYYLHDGAAQPFGQPERLLFLGLKKLVSVVQSMVVRLAGKRDLAGSAREQKVRKYGSGGTQKCTWTNRLTDNQWCRQTVWEQNKLDLGGGGIQLGMQSESLRSQLVICHRRPCFSLQICGSMQIQMPGLLTWVSCQCWVTLVEGAGLSSVQWETMRQSTRQALKSRWLPNAQDRIVTFVWV